MGIPVAKTQQKEKPPPSRFVFEEDPKASAESDQRIRRWITLGFVLSALIVVYSVTRDTLYRRIVYGYAQEVLNSFATGTVEKIGSVEITVEGNLVLRDAVMTTVHRDRRRVFYRAQRMEVALDGWPLRDEKVYVSRVDLFHPEMWVVRETGGDWNIVQALQRAPADGAPPPGPQAWTHPIRGGWPRNGVHIHDGIVHVTFVRDNGSELTWDIEEVQASLHRAETGIRFGPFTGSFYGGSLVGDATIPSYNPFQMAFQVTVEDADVARIAAGRPFFKKPLHGRMDGVLTLKADRETIGERPIAAGRIEIRDGDLWEVPAFVSVLATLSLTEVGERKLEEARIEFTVERQRVRIDQMDFLGTPLCLFGDGTMDVTGENLDITMVPRIGKSWNDILPIIGAPIQWLSEIVKGALVPVRITGAFWAPELNWSSDEPVSDPVKKLIEEKSPD